MLQLDTLEIWLTYLCHIVFHYILAYSHKQGYRFHLSCIHHHCGNNFVHHRSYKHRPGLDKIKLKLCNTNIPTYMRQQKWFILFRYCQHILSNNLPKICITKFRILFEASCPSFAGAAKVVAQPEIKKVSNYCSCLPCLTIRNSIL